MSIIHEKGVELTLYWMKDLTFLPCSGKVHGALGIYVGLRFCFI